MCYLYTLYIALYIKRNYIKSSHLRCSMCRVWKVCLQELNACLINSIDFSFQLYFKHVKLPESPLENDYFRWCGEYSVVPFFVFFQSPFSLLFLRILSRDFFSWGTWLADTASHLLPVQVPFLKHVLQCYPRSTSYILPGTGLLILLRHNVINLEPKPLYPLKARANGFDKKR